jgi:hypothetical protein
MEHLMDRVGALEQSLREMEADFARRLRFWRGIALVLVVAGGVVLSLRTATAQPPTATLLQRLTTLENLLAHFSRAGNDIFITGANLHIVNGRNSTDITNGLGNVIIGYNETGSGFGDVRTGSHNVVVGSRQNFASFGGLVVGENNYISGPFASVTGGNHNWASNSYSSISGGGFNRAFGEGSSVSGGSSNKANGTGAWVGGGIANTAGEGPFGIFTSVSGGSANIARADGASISGGTGVVQDTHHGWSAGSQGGATVVGDFRSP